MRGWWERFKVWRIPKPIRYGAATAVVVLIVVFWLGGWHGAAIATLVGGAIGLNGARIQRQRGS